MRVITRSYKSITKSYKREWEERERSGTIGLGGLGIGWREGWRGLGRGLGRVLGRILAGLVPSAWPSPSQSLSSPHSTSI